MKAEFKCTNKRKQSSEDMEPKIRKPAQKK